MESKNDLEQKLNKEFQELNVNKSQRKKITNFLNVLKQRDEATFEHSVRVGMIGKDIAEYMNLDPKPLFYAGTLHDLGKTLIDGDILRKTEGFSEEDMKVMRKHPLDSYRFLKGILDFTAEIVVRGHSFQKDKYPKHIPKSNISFSDGTGTMINFYSRLLGLADFYDSLSYRKNDKFGKKDLSYEEKKKLLLKYNIDQRNLIEGLLENEIFKFYTPLSITGKSSRFWEATSGVALSDGADMETKQKRIKELGLPGLDMLVFENADRVRNNEEKIKNFISRYGSVVVWASSGLEKLDKPSVKSYEEFDGLMKSLNNEKDYKVLAWSMVEGMPDSYIGNAVSDGAGKLLIEFYKKPYFTDIRALSRGTCEPNLLSHLYVENFDDIIVSAKNIPELDQQYLVNELAGHKGYFGFIKGIKGKKEGIYFIQHELTAPFLSLLNGANSYHTDFEKRISSLIDFHG